MSKIQQFKYESRKNEFTNFFGIVMVALQTMKKNKRLLARTVPTNKNLLARSVPVNKNLFARTVPLNKKLFARTIPNGSLYNFDPGSGG